MLNRIVIWIGMIGLALPIISVAGVFSTSGRELFLDGSAFEVRGVCYQPTPIGQDPSAGPPFGDYFTSSYATLWARDFENLRLMGANVIRVYGWTIGANHQSFLDAAYNGGDASLYVLVNRYINPATDWGDTNAVNALIADWSAMADELKEHPAVIGFLVGNEVNVQNGNGFDPQFWNAMNQIAGAVKTVAPDKLVSVAITDALNQVETRDATMTHLDFWALQVYRGTGFGTFFDDYAARSTKPLVITEFGYDAYDARINDEFADDAAFPADAMENLLNEISDNRPVVSGGCIFEYADEWWKTGNPSTQDAPAGWPGPFVDGEANEEWWGIFRIVDNGNQPDIIQPRAMFYRVASMWNAPYSLDTIQSGHAGGQPSFELNMPEHLRDQRLQVEISTNLTDWLTVADNSRSILPESFTPTVVLTATETNRDIQVTLTHTPTTIGPYEPASLIDNGHFDDGSTLGWMTFGSASTAVAQSGDYSLRLDAAGGFSVPSAYQTVAASPGQEFNMSGFMYAAQNLPTDNTFGVFKIVFADQFGTDLPPASISIGTDAGFQFPGAESVPILNSTQPTGTWLFSEVQAVAPADTVSVTFFILNVDQSANTMFYDSIHAVEAATVPAIDNEAFFRYINSGR